MDKKAFLLLLFFSIHIFNTCGKEILGNTHEIQLI